jgi:hypothetical protein
VNLNHPLVKKIIDALNEKGLNPNDDKCPIINAICPLRLPSGRCRYTRVERALAFFDCAYE